MVAKLLTVTSNPSLDRMLHLPHLTSGAVHRAYSVRLGAGGKGLNVARAAQRLGQEVVATGILAGHGGRLVEELAQQEGLNTAWWWLKRGETRVSVHLIHESMDATVINEPGPAVSEQDWLEFSDYVGVLADSACAVAVSSSIPPEVKPQQFKSLCQTLLLKERIVYLDTSGPALAAVLEEPRNICVKVNESELRAAWTDEKADFLEIGDCLLKRGAMALVVTMGAKGALCIAEQGIWQSTVPVVDVESSIGCGDSFLAGLAIARIQGESWPEALRFGTACGVANAVTANPADIERLVVDSFMPKVSIHEFGSL